MKIFMGMYNIASLMHDYTAGFQKLGHEVFSVHLGDSPIQSQDVDLCIPHMLAAKQKEGTTNEDLAIYSDSLLKEAWDKALNSDVCMFFWESFLKDASDIRLLKKMGKKIIIRLCGSEVRIPEISKEAHLFYSSPYTEYMENTPAIIEKKLRYLRTAELYADLIIGHSDFSLRPASHTHACLFNSDGYAKETRQNEYPIILHAPSKTATKGTGAWLQVFDILRSSGLKFGTKIVQGLPHSQMPEEYASADIFCDSLIYGGRASLEAMAAGCIPVGRGYAATAESYIKNADEFLNNEAIPPTSQNHKLWLKHSGLLENAINRPGIFVTPENAVQKLAKLIMNFPARLKIAHECYTYATKTMSPENACDKIIAYLNEPEKTEHKMTLIPKVFFNKHFTAEVSSQENKEIYNKYNKMVKYCRWYKKHVTPCHRNGLQF
ncbi:hypothetical protein [Maridesulfovibrio sp.]|uniref:glycosyltransferase n=1 Tax=Maridesulfovibrio sp. TaxID=2795000 RepID=UPI002A189CEE|nr:hypothetical protein [Maridesulfovibrio sp.]